MRVQRNIKHRWTRTELGSQEGRTALITGTGGIGYESALALAGAGATVIIAGRNEASGAEAVVNILKLFPKAKIQFEQIDLANLASIKAFCSRIKKQFDTLDVLINNAGVMAIPKRKVTNDGFEYQLGINYLGHFALTNQLIPLLQKAKQARVITVSSLAHRTGKIDFADLQMERNYDPDNAYSQSKLACLMFAFELQRRSEVNGWGITSIGVTPGGVATQLIKNGPGFTVFTKWIVTPILQTPSQGARSSLLAATSNDMKGGLLYGPTGFMEVWGKPKLVKPAPQAEDVRAASKLWDTSIALTQ